MKDIVPELLEAIEKDFQSRVDASPKLIRILKLIDEGKATYAEANEYAVEVGDILADVFSKHLSSDILPDGRMYYNIADRILNPTLRHDHNLISSVSADIQTSLNQASNLGIKGIPAPLNQDRINGIVERVSQEPVFDDVKWILDEPVKNFSQAIVDETVKINADFQYKAGLRPKIIRKEVGNCCDWCKEVVGTYEYPDVPKDVYKRHRYCRCTVEYHPGDGRRQNVHTKKWAAYQEQERLERIERIERLASDQPFSNTTPAKFARAVEEAKQMVPKEDAWRVSVYDPDHYVGSKLHLTTKKSTVAVDVSGDIISVCRRQDDHIRGSELVKEAVKNGGIKLDSYSGNHVFYVKNGFEAVSWCEWVDDYAPDDWDPTFQREPIIFYRYTGEMPEIIESATDFRKRIPASADYDEAQKVRDDLIGGK